jgi:hypothetical protein
VLTVVQILQNTDKKEMFSLVLFILKLLLRKFRARHFGATTLPRVSNNYIIID